MRFRIDDEECYFSKDQKYYQWRGVNLPHREQKGKVQFITWHLADSIPKQRRDELAKIRQNLLSDTSRNWDIATKIRFINAFSKRINDLLDAGYGSCPFTNPKHRKTLMESLMFYDGQKYDLLAWVVMPNMFIF